MATPASALRRAVVTTGRSAVAVRNVPFPSPGPGELIVKTAAVGLNPTDWKSLARLPAVDAIIGVDFSGTVDRIGDGVSKFRPGDRVAGFVHGSVASNHEYGSFTEFVLAFEHLTALLPDHMDFEEGAILGVGITTVRQALGQTLQLPWPSPKPTSKALSDTTVLIYAGQTATGSLAIQFAAMSGVRVITTSSPESFDRMQTLGAEKAFDYVSHPKKAHRKSVKADCVCRNKEAALGRYENIPPTSFR